MPYTCIYWTTVSEKCHVTTVYITKHTNLRSNTYNIKCLLLNLDFGSRFWTHKPKFYSRPCRLTKKVKLNNVLTCGTSCIIIFFQAGHTHALGIHRWFTHNTVYSMRVHYTRLEPANTGVFPVVPSLHPKSNHSCPAQEIKIYCLP